MAVLVAVALILLFATPSVVGDPLAHLQVQVLNEPAVITSTYREVGIPEQQETLTFEGRILKVIEGDESAAGSEITVRIEYYTQPISDAVRSILAQIHRDTVLEIIGGTQNAVLTVNLGNSPDHERWIKVISSVPIPEFPRDPDVAPFVALIVIAAVVFFTGARPLLEERKDPSGALCSCSACIEDY